MNKEYLQLEYYINKNQIKESLKIVHNYIQKNNLILVGGEASNYALKTKGSQIYDEYSVADYDCISPNFYEHAKRIGEILCKKEFSDVNIINAIHNTTVRVKVSNYTVFDSTYCPQNVYNNLETIKYLGLNIIHPNYQKIDQYNSLSYLFDQTGITQNIYHRMKKDIERNEILVKYFPITSNIKPDNLIDIEIPLDLIIADKFKIFKTSKENIDSSYVESIDDICCHGFLAYSIYYQGIYDIYLNNKHNLNKKEIQKINNLFDKCVNTSFKIDKKKCIYNLPTDEYTTFINGTNNIENIKYNIKKNYNISKIETFNKLLEVQPITQIYYTDKINFQIFDTTGRLLSCNLFKFNDNDIIVSNYNYLLSYFLSQYYYYERNDYYLTYYLSVINIIKIAQILFTNNINDELLNNYNYSISTYGNYNYNESFYYFINNFNYLLKYNKNSSDKPGRIYTEYPDCDVDKEFDVLSSKYFQIDGKINNDIIETNNIYVVKKNNII